MELENQNLSRSLAEQTYQKIQSKANSNMLLQGISALFGGLVTAGVDVAVIITHYVPMFNQIRYIYNRGPVEENAIVPIIKNIFNE